MFYVAVCVELLINENSKALKLPSNIVEWFFQKRCSIATLIFARKLL